jgi:hypothetical protein
VKRVLIACEDLVVKERRDSGLVREQLIPVIMSQ